jgi:hypothetical protein
VGLWKKPCTGIARPRGEALTTDEARGQAGEYQLLYKYLRDRFANRVVLTFAEIEDLLGFALPDAARLQREWWACTDPMVPRSAQSISSMLASRTTTVNLVAQRVVFDRIVGER